MSSELETAAISGEASPAKKEKEMPFTISVLDAPLNGKVYLVGTAHFSVESQKEVAELIRKVRPTSVVLELCPARVNILKLDEETVLREAREMNTAKMIETIRKVSSEVPQTKSIDLSSRSHRFEHHISLKSRTRSCTVFCSCCSFVSTPK